MRLHEYEAKLRLAEFGIPVPEGRIAAQVESAVQAATDLTGPVMVKAQVMSRDRSAQRGIRRAETPGAVRFHARELFEHPIDGVKASRVLVERVVDIQRGLYIAITHDRSARKPVLIVMDEDGFNQTDDEEATVLREHIAPLIGLRSYQITTIASQLNLPREYWPQFNRLALNLYRCFETSDASLIELHPLGVTHDAAMVVVHAHMVIDDNALFRQPKLAALRATAYRSESERIAFEAGLTYIKLEGQIGCITNGAGLAMTIIDLIHGFGDNHIGPANFLDVSGGARFDKWMAAFYAIHADPNVRCALVNVFGGMTPCDDVAEALVLAHEQAILPHTVIVRLKGNRAEQGLALLRSARLPGVVLADSLTGAVQLAVHAAKGNEA